MRITDKNYNDIVDGVYNVDAGKVKRPWRVNGYVCRFEARLHLC